MILILYICGINNKNNKAFDDNDREQGVFKDSH